MTAQAIPLSPIDLYFAGATVPPITTVYIYRSGALDPGLIRESLLKATAPLVSLRGTLVPIAGNSLAFTDGGPGPQFEQIHDGTISALSLTPAAVMRFADPVRNVPGEPLIRVRLTDTPDRQYLAVSVSHASTDAIGNAQFMDAWTHQARGEGDVFLDEDRTPLIPLLTDPILPVSAAEIFEKTGFLMDAAYPRQDGVEGDVRDVIVSRATLAREIPSSAANEHGLFTSWDVLSALVGKWLTARASPDLPITLQSVVAVRRTRKKRREEPVSGKKPADALSVPLNYLGNAFHFARALLPIEELLSGDLSKSAARIRQSLMAPPGPGLCESLEALTRLRLTQGLDAMTHLAMPYYPNHISISNLAGMLMPEMNFGSGRPIAMIPLHWAPNVYNLTSVDDTPDSAYRVRVFQPSRP